jgi:hypothetical protein
VTFVHCAQLAALSITSANTANAPEASAKRARSASSAKRSSVAVPRCFFHVRSAFSLRRQSEVDHALRRAAAAVTALARRGQQRQGRERNRRIDEASRSRPRGGHSRHGMVCSFRCSSRSICAPTCSALALTVRILLRRVSLGCASDLVDGCARRVNDIDMTLVTLSRDRSRR